MFLRVYGEETIVSLSSRLDRKRTPHSSVKGSGANHYPRAPAPNRSREKLIFLHVACGKVLKWQALSIYATDYMGVHCVYYCPLTL